MVTAAPLVNSNAHVTNNVNGKLLSCYFTDIFHLQQLVKILGPSNRECRFSIHHFIWNGLLEAYSRLKLSKSWALKIGADFSVAWLFNGRFVCSFSENETIFFARNNNICRVCLTQASHISFLVVNFVKLHRVRKKGATLFLPVTLRNAKRFSKFFYLHTLQ